MASPGSYQKFVQQLKRQGVNAQLFSYNNPNQKSSIELLGDLQEGIIFFDVLDDIAAAKKYKIFLGEYLEKYPKGPDSPYLLSAAYNGFISIINSLENGNRTSEEIKFFLTNNSIESATGDLKFDVNGDLENQNLVLKKIINGMSEIMNY